MLKHRYTKTIRKIGLFKGSKSFEEVEKQIENHSGLNKDRGDAFEVFAEAYLTLGINLPYKKVFPENKLTAKHFNKLRITSTDTNVRGIDGVLETESDEFHTYQVKYRSSGNTLSWNDLTGSVVASENADSLLIFTNASDIDGDIAQRNVYSVRKDKLDELTSDDLKRIEHLIYKKEIKKKKAIKLDPYQKDAIKAVLKKLKTDSRTQLIMPCGSGKTIVGQRIIESIKDAKTILILVPTLQLLNDTFENYFNDTSWDNFPFMCVGSKVVDNKAYDQMDVDPSELPIVTRTDSESVKAFLKKEFDKHIIFSTYQSLPVVADALGKRKVDVAIFDEAHNTASKKGNYWTFGLDDEKITINKRIFMTATPRKYQLRRKNEEDMRISYSMDNPEVFGDIAYKLSFKKAADEYGAICRYKIIISVITSKYFTREKLRDGDVLIGYSDVNAENIAKQIALQDAVNKNSINKIISFHPTITHSENFVGESDISVKHRLKGFDLYNVSSKQNMGVRRSTMNAFRKADTALISNAQCLNEGVDVPAVDMVAFMSPKKSKVSIVQAVGRAIRKPRGSNKEWGYVFVPIFLEKASGESDIEAAEQSNFKDVYEVVNALREHDEVLDEVIKNLRIQKGNKGTINGSILDDFIQIDGKDLSIQNLEEHIQSEIVDRMVSNWFHSYGILKNYYEKYCNSELQEGLIYKGLNLRSWAKTQHDRKRNGTLEKERETLLNKLDLWSWPPSREELSEYYEEQWFHLYEQFKEKVEYDLVYCDLKNNPEIKRLDGTAITARDWIARQRHAYVSGELEKTREKALKKLPNFEFAPLKARRNKLISEVENHKNEFGQYYMPRGFITETGYPLNERIGTIVDRATSGNEFSLKFVEQYPFYKLKEYEQLIFIIKSYANHFGHTRPQDGEEFKLCKIFSACNTIRAHFRKNNLEKKYIDELESLPYWSWNTDTDNWIMIYTILYEHVKNNGYVQQNDKITWDQTTIPKPPFELKQNVSKDGKYIFIGRFQNQQRQNFIEYLQGKKDPSELQTFKINKMKKIGYWGLNREETLLYFLNKFIDKYGHSRVERSQIIDGYTLGSRIFHLRLIKSSLSKTILKTISDLPYWSWNPEKDNWYFLYEVSKWYFDKIAPLHPKTDDEIFWDEIPFEKPPFSIGNSKTWIRGIKIGAWIYRNRSLNNRKFKTSIEEDWRKERIRKLNKIKNWEWLK